MQDETPLDEGFGADASLEPPEEVTDAEAEVTETDKAQESEAESPPADEENVEKKTNSAKDRIDKLTERFRSAERELAERERKIAELEDQLSKVPKEPLKTLKDFEYNEEEYGAYIVERTEAIATKAAEQVAKQYVDKADSSESESEYDKRERAFEKEFPDFRQKAYDPDLRISESMAQVIKETDVGPELLYYLGNNPDEASVISRMSPVTAGMELSALVTKIRSEKDVASKKSASKTPPPPATIAGKDAGLRVSTTAPSSDKLSDDEWFKAEEVRLAKLRG